MRLITSLFLALAGWLSGPAFAETAADSIKADAVWVRSVPPVSSTTAGYMTLTNQGTEERLLVGASTTAAGNIELHSNADEEGMMRMRRIAHVHLPGEKSVTLAPAGMHLMIFRLKQPAVAGETMDLVLEFADGSHKTITAEIK